jgi:hypothetical protein
MIEGKKSKGERFIKLAFSYFKTDPNLILSPLLPRNIR